MRWCAQAHEATRPPWGWVAQVCWVVRRPVWLIVLMVCLASSAKARVASFSILYTGELCGRLGPSGVRRTGGLTAVSECIRRERERTPNTLLIDCGNFAYGSYDASVLRSEVLYAVMESLRYDAWIPGWRDWQGGADRMRHPVCKVPMLAANVFGRGNETPVFFGQMPFQVDGVRVTLIGMTSPNTPLCYPSGVLDGMFFDEVIEALGRMMPEVREGEPDMVVLVLDAGIFGEQAGPGLAVQIARHFPEIDILLTRGSKDARRIGALYYAAASLDDQTVGRVAIQYDTVLRELLRAESEVLAVPSVGKIYSAPTWISEESWKAWRSAREESFGILTQAVTGTEGKSGESEAGHFMARAVAAASEADAVFYRPPIGRSLSAGPVAMRDLAEAYPDETVWGLLMLTPEEIRQALEDVFRYQGSDKALVCYGLDFEKGGPEDSGDALRLTSGAGGFLHPRKRHRVAVPLDVMASSGGVYTNMRTLAENPLTQRSSTTVDIYAALMKYIREAGGEPVHE